EGRGVVEARPERGRHLAWALAGAGRPAQRAQKRTRHGEGDLAHARPHRPLDRRAPRIEDALVARRRAAAFARCRPGRVVVVTEREALGRIPPRTGGGILVAVREAE